MVNVTLSPSTLPSVMVDLPVNVLAVSPVTLVPSCLKVNVLSIAPFGPSAVAFQLPLMSAANAVKANSAISAGSHFILQAPFNSRQYTPGQTAHSHPLLRSVTLLIRDKCVIFPRLSEQRTAPMTSAAIERSTDSLRALPGDDVRQLLWRFADRFDLQMLVQSVRAVARGPVARLVAQGARNTHEWTADKQALLQAFDESGITGVFMNPSEGGFIEGPKNLALALVAFELAWVDAGAATGSLAGCLALSPIHERGTQEQRDRYMALAAPPQPGEDRKPWRGAFCLTEPIPYVGVETGMLGGKVRVSEWKEGEVPMLRVEKRGRFIQHGFRQL